MGSSRARPWSVGEKYIKLLRTCGRKLGISKWSILSWLTPVNGKYGSRLWKVNGYKEWENAISPMSR